jgi:hypothetical protein
VSEGTGKHILKILGIDIPKYKYLSHHDGHAEGKENIIIPTMIGTETGISAGIRTDVTA